MSTITVQVAGPPRICERIFCFLCVAAVYAAKTYVFDAINAKKEIESGPYPRKVPAQTRKTAHKHESTVEFSVTPLFAGAAWRGALETAV